MEKIDPLDGGWKLSSITTRNGTQDVEQATNDFVLVYWHPWKDNESHVYTSTPRFNDSQAGLLLVQRASTSALFNKQHAPMVLRTTIGNSQQLAGHAYSFYPDECLKRSNRLPFVVTCVAYACTAPLSSSLSLSLSLSARQCVWMEKRFRWTYTKNSLPAILPVRQVSSERKRKRESEREKRLFEFCLRRN